MKIAFISRWFVEENRRTDGRGGCEQHRVQAFLKMGHEVVVFSQTIHCRRFERHRLNGVSVIVTHRWRRNKWMSILDKLLKPFVGHRKLITDAWDLFHFIRDFGPFDVIEAQCESPDGLVVAFLSLFYQLPPWCVQIFALRYKFVREQPRFTRIHTLGFVFRQAQIVRANSAMVAQIAQDLYGCDPGKMRVTPHNLTRDFLSVAPASSGAGAAPLVLCLSALNAKKGVRYFVEAVPEIRSVLPAVRYQVVGGSTAEDGYASWLKNYAKSKELQGVIDWMGQLDAEQVIQSIQQAAVIVVPSLFDEWNRVAIESLALEKPVVITETCGVAEWVQQHKAGFVIPPGDAPALAQAALTLLQKPLAPSHLKTVSEQVRHEFSPETIAQQCVQTFLEVMPQMR